MSHELSDITQVGRLCVYLVDWYELNSLAGGLLAVVDVRIHDGHVHPKGVQFGLDLMNTLATVGHWHIFLREKRSKETGQMWPSVDKPKCPVRSHGLEWNNCCSNFHLYRSDAKLSIKIRKSAWPLPQHMYTYITELSWKLSPTRRYTRTKPISNSEF